MPEASPSPSSMGAPHGEPDRRQPVLTGMRAVVVALVLLLAAGGVWILGSPGRDRPASTASGGAESPARARPEGPELRGFPETSPGERISGSSTGAAPEEASEKTWPPDPLPTGSCRLRLHIVEAGSRDYVCTDFELWHLDAPASEHWSAGAQMRMGDWSEPSVTVIPDLPAGRYRVVLHDARPGDEDPPAFEVSGPETDVWVELAPPRRFRVRLQIQDVAGRAVTEATRRVWLCSGTQIRPVRPPWAVPRRVIADGRFFKDEGWAHWDGEGANAWEEATADEEGFFTDGGWTESRRNEEAGTTALYRIEGCSDVHLDVEHEGLHDRCYVAVTAPLDWIRARIRHADGRPLGEEDAALAIEARCDGELLPSAFVDPDAWRRLSISVRVERDEKTVGSGLLHPSEPERLLHLLP